jgi:hypothetical protein
MEAHDQGVAVENRYRHATAQVDVGVEIKGEGHQQAHSVAVEGVGEGVGEGLRPPKRGERGLTRSGVGVGRSAGLTVTLKEFEWERKERFILAFVDSGC